MFSKIFSLEDQLWNKQEEYESRIISYGPEIMMMDWHFYHAGYVIPMHDHYHTQVSYVVKGSVKVILADGTEKVCVAGEAVNFAPNEAHSVIVLEDDSYVMDVFNPIRLDHLEKHSKLNMANAAGTSATAGNAANTNASGVDMDEDSAKLMEEMQMMEAMLSNAQNMVPGYGEGEQSWWSDELAAAYASLRGGQRAIFEAMIEYDLPEGQGFNETSVEDWNEALAVPMTPETFAALQLFEREKRAKG